VSAAFPRLVKIDALGLAVREVGNERTMNMVVAGALSVFTPFEESLWLRAMAEMLTGPKARLLAANEKAFALGRAAARA
jgi:Pyruvate/2-oxoacid:ferredoxin oxidoreductase gamma subunit